MTLLLQLLYPALILIFHSPSYRGRSVIALRLKSALFKYCPLIMSIMVMACIFILTSRHWMRYWEEASRGSVEHGVGEGGPDPTAKTQPVQKDGADEKEKPVKGSGRSLVSGGSVEHGVGEGGPD